MQEYNEQHCDAGSTMERCRELVECMYQEDPPVYSHILQLASHEFSTDFCMPASLMGLLMLWKISSAQATGGNLAEWSWMNTFERKLSYKKVRKKAISDTRLIPNKPATHRTQKIKSSRCFLLFLLDNFDLNWINSSDPVGHSNPGDSLNLTMRSFRCSLCPWIESFCL